MEKFNTGISITTRNRPGVFAYTLRHMLEFRPENSKIVVCDDSDKSFNPEYNSILAEMPEIKDFQFVRFDGRAGIPYAKNHAFKLLSDCSFQFWFDDDCNPITPDWDKKVIQAARVDNVNHYLYLKDWAHIKYIDEFGAHTRIFSSGTACFMFFTKKCYPHITKVLKEFDIYGIWHNTLSKTLCGYGLTPAIYCTIKEIDKYIYSFDLDGKPGNFHGDFESSISKEERHAALVNNIKNAQELKKYLARL